MPWKMCWSGREWLIRITVSDAKEKSRVGWREAVERGDWEGQSKMRMAINKQEISIMILEGWKLIVVIQDYDLRSEFR